MKDTQLLFGKPFIPLRKMKKRCEGCSGVLTAEERCIVTTHQNNTNEKFYSYKLWHYQCWMNTVYDELGRDILNIEEDITAELAILSQRIHKEIDTVVHKIGTRMTKFHNQKNYAEDWYARNVSNQEQWGLNNYGRRSKGE